MSLAPKRSLHLRKSVCWLLLFASLGTIFFFLLLVIKGEVRYWGSRETQMLAMASLVLIGSGISLRRSYLIEPANFTGFWHLSLVDLWATMFFSAFLMFMFRAIWPNDFVPIGMVVTVILGLAFAFCLLLAARKGCVEMRLKILCAMSFFWSTLGWMTVGMFLFLITTMSILRSDLHSFFEALFELFHPKRPDQIAFNVIRVGILGIILGYALRKYVETQLEIQRARSEHETKPS